MIQMGVTPGAKKDLSMDNLLGPEIIWYPLKFLGVTHQLSGINISTVLNTWLVLLVIFIISFGSRFFINKQNSLTGYILKNTIKSFIDLVEQSVGKFVERYYTFITSIFFYIICCNWVALFPYAEEPTKDLNTTLSLGIIAFLFMHKEMIKNHGVLAYLKDLFTPIKLIFPFNIIVGLLMFPLKLLGELATIISLSFRLFGNIFGGFVISSIFHHAISGSVILNFTATLLGVNLLITMFFIIFEGFLQAFVFSILSLTNIAMAVQTEGEGNVV